MGKTYTVLSGGTVVTPQGILENGVVVIHGGRILTLGTASELAIPDNALIFSCTGSIVLPGFIDVHVHGCSGNHVMSGKAEEILAMARALARYGVTGFLPTTIAAPHQELAMAMQACSEAHARQEEGVDGAQILGIHLEGPYINPDKKGAQPIEGIRLPDLSECNEYLRLAPNLVRLVTLAPEMPGASDLISLLIDHGVRISMGHTDADYATALKAIDAGATHATHLFNQMSPIHHRSPGLVTACLNDNRVTVELITDGVHLAPEIIRMVFRCKGFEKVCLITDAIAALGMPEGRYQLGPQAVTVGAGRCTLDNGTLAGSVHRMDRAIYNTIEFANCTLEEASHTASAVPAQVLGVSDRKGLLREGYDADIVVMRDGEVSLTLVGGEPVYERAQAFS